MSQTQFAVTPHLATYGSDPEQILFSRKLNKIVSAIPVLKVDKHTPIDLGNGFKVYSDNVAIESNVPPASTRQEFIDNFRELFKRVSNHVGDNYEIRNVASNIFTEEEVDHDWARIAGCSPEFDAYEMAVCYPPQFEGAFRSQGGHVHIGRKDYKDYLDNPENVPLIDPYNKADVIKLMDIFVGTTLTLIDKDPTSHARKKLYGAAGRHRPTPYGVEYRTLGNFWLNSPELVGLIYDLTAHVIEINNDEGLREETIDSVTQEVIEKAINDNSPAAARLVHTVVNMPAELEERINNFAALTAEQVIKPLAESWNY